MEESKSVSSYQAIFAAANDAILVLDMETGRIIDANRAACEIFCFPMEEIHRLTLYDLSSGEASYTPEEIMKLMNKASGGESQLFEWLVKDKAGRLFWVEVSLKRAVIEGKYRLLAVVRDISERKNAEQALRESEERHRILADNIPIHIAAIDQSGKFIVWNKFSEKLLGYTAEEAVDKMSPRDIHETKKDAYEVIRVATEKGIYDKEINLVHKNKKRVSVRLVVIPSKNPEGEITGFYGFGEDIAGRKKTEQELIKSNKRLEELALRDLQTGLYNHHYLEEIIEMEFYRARRHVHPLSVIMLDIDYFKSINDVYGHEFGDLVLVQFAKQLKKMARRYDAVVRFGGEEFVVISSGMSRPDSLSFARRLFDAISLYQFGNKKYSVKLKVSIAVSSYPDDKVTKGMDLINLTDRILDRAKDEGGDRVYSSLDMKKKKGRHAEDDHENNKIKEITFLKGKIAKLKKGGRQNLIESIFAFAKTIELKDHYTGEHTEKTVYYATEIARALHLSREETESIKEAAVLHDLGKIGISEKILLKKGRLTRKEFGVIKNHPQIGADILRPIHFMHDIIPLIFYHHERWDGKGYPIGLKGEEIPIGARIIAVADVYQALTSNRPYRKAYSKEKSIKIIRDGSGTQFDPKIVNIFLGVLKKERQK